MKTQLTIKDLRLLPTDSFENLFKVNNRKVIASNYNIHVATLAKEISQRQDKEKIEGLIISEMNIPIPLGAWMNSKERYCFVQSGLMSNIPMIN